MIQKLKAIVIYCFLDAEKSVINLWLIWVATDDSVCDIYTAIGRSAVARCRLLTAVEADQGGHRSIVRAIRVASICCHRDAVQD